LADEKPCLFPLPEDLYWFSLNATAWGERIREAGWSRGSLPGSLTALAPHLSGRFELAVALLPDGRRSAGQEVMGQCSRWRVVYRLQLGESLRSKATFPSRQEAEAWAEECRAHQYAAAYRQRRARLLPRRDAGAGRRDSTVGGAEGGCGDSSATFLIRRWRCSRPGGVRPFTPRSHLSATMRFPSRLGCPKASATVTFRRTKAIKRSCSPS
jgi:hypothetical protein